VAHQIQSQPPSYNTWRAHCTFWPLSFNVFFQIYEHVARSLWSCHLYVVVNAINQLANVQCTASLASFSNCFLPSSGELCACYPDLLGYLDNDFLPFYGKMLPCFLLNGEDLLSCKAGFMGKKYLLCSHQYNTANNVSSPRDNISQRIRSPEACFHREANKLIID